MRILCRGSLKTDIEKLHSHSNSACVVDKNRSNGKNWEIFPLSTHHGESGRLNDTIKIRISFSFNV